MRPIEFLHGGYRIRFKWIDKETMALCSYEKDTIIINLILSIVDSFVHEFLHATNPDWTEQMVLEHTRTVINRMTVKEIKKLYREILKEAT